MIISRYDYTRILNQIHPFPPPSVLSVLSVLFVIHDIHAVVHFINPARLMIAEFLTEMEIAFSCRIGTSFTVLSV